METANPMKPDQQSDLGLWCLQYRLTKNCNERADDNCLEWQENGSLKYLNNGCFRCIFLIYF